MKKLKIFYLINIKIGIETFYNDFISKISSAIYESIKIKKIKHKIKGLKSPLTDIKLLKTTRNF